jgi:putative RecB family exonuclease
MAEYEGDHLSYSSVNLYQSCPAAWRYRYIEKVKTPTSPSLVFGSAFHGALEVLIAAHARGEQRQVHEVWGECWQKATDQEVAWNGDLPQELSNQGLRMLASEDTANILSNLRPLMADGGPVIERRVELRVPGVPIPIIGFIDLQAVDCPVIDFKTAARAWAPDKASKETQPLFYLAALNQAGFPLPQLTARHIVWVKTRKLQVQQFDTQRTIGEVFALLKTIQGVWTGIAAGSFPMNTSTWKCSPKWCEYYQTCRGV